MYMFASYTWHVSSHYTSGAWDSKIALPQVQEVSDVQENEVAGAS